MMLKQAIIEKFEAIRNGKYDKEAFSDWLVQAMASHQDSLSEILEHLDHVQYEYPLPIMDFVWIRNHARKLGSSPQITAESSLEATRVAAANATLTQSPLLETQVAPETQIAETLIAAPQTLEPTQVTQTTANIRLPTSRHRGRGLAAVLAVITLASALYWFNPSAESINPPSHKPATPPGSTPAPLIDQNPALPSIQTVSITEQRPKPAELAQVDYPQATSPKEWLAAIRDQLQRQSPPAITSPDSADYLLKRMGQQFPKTPELLEARRLVKDAYVKAAEQARLQGDWDKSQQYLNAAFTVLEPDA